MTKLLTPVKLEILMSLELLLAGVLTVIGVTFFFKWHERGRRKTALLTTIISWIIVFPLAWEVQKYAPAVSRAIHIDANSFIQKRDTGAIVYIASKAVDMWADDSRLINARVIAYQSQYPEVDMATLMKTSDGRPRILCYGVTFEIYGSPESYVACQKLLWNGRAWDSTDQLSSDFKDYAMRLLYEFDEKEASRLAQFYNPQDKKQQADFQTLVNNYLKPWFEPGQIKITEARFAAL